MDNQQIKDIQRIFSTRLDTLEHILTKGEKHLSDGDGVLKERLAPDMLPLGTQIAFVCNQPRGFAQWCAGQPTQNLDPSVMSLEVAHALIQDTKDLLNTIEADDSKLEEITRTELGHGMVLETPAHLYISDFLIPNFYFHISITYAILRHLGVALGKADYMGFLMPHVQQEG
jgi:hypothetical protein